MSLLLSRSVQAGRTNDATELALKSLQMVQSQSQAVEDLSSRYMYLYGHLAHIKTQVCSSVFVSLVHNNILSQHCACDGHVIISWRALSSVNAIKTSFWATVCKTVRPMLSVCCLSVCPVLSVTLVYCGKTVGRIKMKLGVQVGLEPGHTVLSGDPAPPPLKGTAPNFRPISVAAK